MRYTKAPTGYPTRYSTPLGAAYKEANAHMSTALPPRGHLHPRLQPRAPPTPSGST